VGGGAGAWLEGERRRGGGGGGKGVLEEGGSGAHGLDGRWRGIISKVICSLYVQYTVPTRRKHCFYIG
jgi:hypothetical protein